MFTGAFLEALGGMVLKHAARPRVDDVEQASVDMGRLLARGIVDAPVSTRFFQAVAEQLVLADSDLFAGKYAEALTIGVCQTKLDARAIARRARRRGCDAGSRCGSGGAARCGHGRSPDRSSRSI